MTTMQTQGETSNPIKTSIKTSALLLLDGLPYRYGEFLNDLQAQMSPMERGQMFFEVRLAVQELIDEGTLAVLEFKTPQRTGKLIVPAGFSWSLESGTPNKGINALEALNAENWLDEDSSDTDGLTDAKEQARACLAEHHAAVKQGAPV
ncbi:MULTISPECIES: hypothetical protein [Pseudomonas]|uniref:Uncharacterized protein n=2 Tax=Pseudomonas TaxID=286 RepID=A0A7X1L0T8_9PSED|nr:MULTISPECIES: hypothetical protein [Pseudomonas]MBC2693519.1 hypothetical protein [Pseudomonas kielensis]MDD1011094.1 hypothetical protein [Pseudomonas shahriarae]